MNETYMPTVAQQKAIDESGKILVSAAAGSGKTKTMISRILKLVGSGALLRRMLILVYNNASAEELKEKLHQGLFEKACEAVGDMRELYRRQLDELSFSSICTIHSFCQSLIRENFDKLVVSPSFSVLDEKRHLAYMNRAIESVFAEYFAENDALFNDIADIFSQGRSEDNLKKVVLRLYNFVDIQPHKEDFLANVDSCYKSFENGAFADIILRTEKKAMKAISVECDKLLNPLSSLGELSYFDNVEKLKRMAEAMAAAANFTTVLEIAKGGFDKTLARIKGKTEDAKYWVERAKSIVKFASDDIKALAGCFCDINFMKQAHAQNAKYVGKLLEIVDRFSAKLEELKACDGVLSFSDLEHKAVELISQGGNYGENFDYVFVDEYQDVNPTQEYIIASLVRNNCFMVGDIKQSIYGFRMADPTIFLAREKNYKEGGGIEISFNKNFRSDQSILNFVNGIFDVVMTNDSADVDYKNEARFETDGQKIAPNVQLHLFAPPPAEKTIVSGLYDIMAHEQKAEVDSVFQCEGKFIAREIKSLVGKALTDDKNSGRTIEYGDIAVLFRSRNCANAEIIATLENEGIPVDKGGFSKVSVLPERELILFLKALDNPRQDIPFAGFLLSYFGGYTEAELAKIATAPGVLFYDKFVNCKQKNTSNIDNRIENNNKNENKNEIEYEFENEIINKKATSNIDEAIAKKVDKTLQMLSNYRKTMAFKSVAELMKNIVADFSYDAYLTSVGGSMAVGLMSFIASVAEAKYISLKKFLNEYAEVDAKESGVKYGGNRVKISTFHGFKGLEMPVVFVSDIASPFNTKSTAGDVLADGNGFIGISFFDLNKKTKSKTLSLLATKMRIDERESKEEMRLFYVALTRAKQYMYVTASLSSEKRMRSFASIPKIDLPSCNLDFVSNAVLEGNLDVCTFSHLGSDSASQSATANKNIPLLSVGGNQHLQQVIAESQKFVYPFAEATSLARKYSVSALDRVENETVRIFEEAANIGTLYHRVMEHIDFNAESLEAVSLELDNMVASGILSEAERGLIVADDIVKCLSSSIMQLAKRSVCLREQEFMMYIPANETGGNFNSCDKVLVQGVVDLIIDGEECVIVDFKNSYLRDKDMLEKYKKQLNLYKRAVESAFTGKKFKIALYSFKTGQVLKL